MDADELKLQFATILNLLTIIASVIVLFVTKQTTAYWRVYLFVICIMLLGMISAGNLSMAFLNDGGQMAVGIIVSLISTALAIYMLTRMWGERAAIMGHFNYGTKIGVQGWISYIVIGVVSFLVMVLAKNDYLVCSAVFILIGIVHGIINNIFGINVITVILSIVEMLVVGILCSIDD